MNYKSKLRTSPTGKALANWLNGQPEEHPTALLIRFCVNAEQAQRERGLVPEFDKDFWELSMNVRAKARPRHGHIELEFVPQDEDSRALYRFWELLNSGNAPRLKPCQNCGKLFYSDGRADRRTCTK